MRRRTPHVRVTSAASTCLALATAVACGTARERPAEGAGGESSSSAGSGGGRAGGDAAGSVAGASGRAAAGVGAGGGAGTTHDSGEHDAAIDPVESDAGMDASSDAECVVALRLDDCCFVYEPVRRARLQADACLVQLPVGPTFGTDVTLPCQTRSCVGVSCPRVDPPSRIAVADGEGGCRYADECRSDEDCGLGSSTNGCCDCPRSLPVALFDQNPCIYRQDEPYPTSEQCLGCTAPVQCGMCMPPPAPHCAIRDSFNACE